MRILGIDPGYAILGYGVLDMKGNRFSVVTYGSILTDSNMDMPARLQLLYDGLCEIIEEYEPEEASIEELFFNNNAKTAILVGEARGVAVLACAKNGLNISEYTPLQIKQALVGYGRADKKLWSRPFLIWKMCLNLMILQTHWQLPYVTAIPPAP